MCNPTLIALTGFGLSAGAQILGHTEQNKESKRNEKDARRDAAVQIGDVNLRMAQETQAAQQQIEEVDRQTRTVVSEARVAAAEAGVAGNSVDGLLNQIEAEGSTFKGDVATNKANVLQQLDRSKAGIISQAQSRANSVPRANPFATGLKIATGALDTFTRIQSRKPI